MEVFPIEDPVPPEVGSAPASQVEQMKSWDASFAQLEKMLQTATDTKAENDISNDLSNSLTFPSKPFPQTANQEHKRKRNDSGGNSNDSTKMKLKRTSTSTTLPGGVTLTLLNPLKGDNDVSDVISHLGCKEKDLNENVLSVNSELDIQSEICNVNASCVVLQKTEVSNKNDTDFLNSPSSQNMNCESFSKEQSPKNLVDEESGNECMDNESEPNLLENKGTEMQSDTVDNLNLPKLFDSAAEGTSSILNEGQENELSQPVQDNQNMSISDDVQHQEQDVKETLSSSNIVHEDRKPNTENNVEEPNNKTPCERVIKEEDSSEKISKKEDVTEKNSKKDENSDKNSKKDDSSDKNSKKDDKKKKKFERCNIRDIKLEDELDAVTLSAQKEEQERIKRLQEAQMRALQERLQIIEVEKEALSQLFNQPASDDSNLYDSASESTESTEVDDKAKIPLIKTETDIVLLKTEEGKKDKLEEEISTQVEREENIIDISSSSSDSGSDSENELDKKDDDVLVLSDEGEAEAGPEDPNNSGAHTNDCFNLPDLEGRVLVNVGHPPEDPDIYLAPQIAKVIKPHQIGGIRFLYDNVVENLERYKSSSGFGCILAHSMGLGKTVQVVSFVDVFLRHTPATLVLCIVPINTIQNWKAEFDMWVPSSSTVDNEQVVNGEVRPRDYTVYTLNENFKTMAARASLIAEWRNEGGVLLMGYEMYRMLALRKMPKIPAKKGRRLKKQEPIVEPETVDQIKKSMDQMYEHIVIPGPDLVICDEGHRIKNSLASTSMALKSIKTRRRVVLTGYPLQNNLLEYWCMVDFVRPNYLGSRAEFCNMFERPISNGQCIDSTPRDRQLMRFRSHVLHSLLVGFVQRRGHSVLRAVLPKKEEHVLLIRMTPIQRKLYKCFVKDLLYVQQATNPLKLFAVCCKIWNHPDILYKLLQEKQAQEDIDLDIDIASTAGSSATTTIKRKTMGKDQKLKIVPRPLKAIEGPDFNCKPEQATCQGIKTELCIKTENLSFDTNQDQKPPLIQENMPVSELGSQVCKEEYSSSIQLPGVHKTDYSQNPHEASQSKSFPSLPQYSQSSSFCQNFASTSGIQCHSSMTPKSTPYIQPPLHQPYATQSTQQCISTSISQHVFPQQTTFSQMSNSQQYPQPSNSAEAINQQPVSQGQQQYSMKSNNPIEQSFTKSLFEDDFSQPMPQFGTQGNSQYIQQASMQQYPQSNSQQYSQTANQPQIPFNQDQPATNPQFSQPINSQKQFNHQTLANQDQFKQSHQQYTQHSITQPYSSSTHSNMHSQQYSQPLQNFNDSSQHQQYSEKNVSQSYSEQAISDSQQHHEQASVEKGQYPDHGMQPRFSHHSSVSQQYCHSPPQQFPHLPQSTQPGRSQQSYPQQSDTLEVQPSFAHLPNQRMDSQSPRQPHYQQQSSPPFGRQPSPIQMFSPGQQSFPQQSPPLQQSPKNQFSMSSPTQQSYPQQFSQQSPNHSQYMQQGHQYSQDASQQQSYPQSQYSHHSSSQQYPKHSSPQQQYPLQPPKQTYVQQFMQHGQQYPRQPSPQQNFQQQPRQTSFSHPQQQPYSHQPVQHYQSSGTPRSPFPPQGHTQFPPVSPQPSSQGQSFPSTSTTSGNSHQFNQQQQQQLPAMQQYGSLQQQPSHSLPNEKFPLQSTQSKSSKSFSQPNLSPQPAQASVNVQYSQQPSQPYAQTQSQYPQQCLQGQQYQQSFTQQQQQNSQPSFQQYQSQQPQSTVSMQPPVQIPPTPQSNVKQGQGKLSQNQMKITCQPVMHKPCDPAGETQYQHQPFQNNVSKQVLPVQQQNKPATTISSAHNFPKVHSTLASSENFASENIKDESNPTFPSKCTKTAYRPVKPQSNVMQNSLVPFQQGQQSRMPDAPKLEVEANTVQEPVVVPVRDRMDSSINYDWAIPLMKDYILGVLENSHKMMVLFAIINKTIEKGDKLLVFSQSLSTLDLLELFLSKIAKPKCTELENSLPEMWCRNKNYFRLDGSTSAQEREKLINEFNRNENVSLFLLSTRAGCLGINLVGANRIVVMDASWNPCHDAQAVCRIYRYGQKKQCHIYRLVTDNSLEKRIYDRQVNKQGMSDRVVDELNPESNFTWKDVTTLIQDDEDDGPVQELSKVESSYTDDVLKHLVVNMSPSLSKEPFEHESLLLDRKDLKLTKQEKRLAKQSYEMAKRASMINIRTTYTYMPGGGGQFVINNKQCQFVGGTTVRVLPGQTVRGATGNTRTGATATPITASPSLMNSLFKQGVMVQKLTIPTSMSVPVLTPGAPPVVVPAGQDVLVLRTPKGVYLRLPDGRIIAVQLPPSLLSKTQFRPNVVTHFRPSVAKGGNQTSGVVNSPRGQSIGIIKQTLQCGGTVRYIGPKNSGNSSKDCSPEVIDLSDDDEPSAKKSNITALGSRNLTEVDVTTIGDKDKKTITIGNKPLLHGKHITIRKVSPLQQNPLQLPSTKDKCDLPLKLQQNQQITIMPINTSGQQNRQKLAPQLAQPVRVQQMLLHPQQGKRKPFQKNATKLFTTLPISKNIQRPHITLTPTNQTDFAKLKHSKVFHVHSKPADNVGSSEKNEHSILSVLSKSLVSSSPSNESTEKESPHGQVQHTVQPLLSDSQENGNNNLQVADGNSLPSKLEIKSAVGNLPEIKSTVGNMPEINSTVGNLAEITDSSKMQLESSTKPFISSSDVPNTFSNTDSIVQSLKPQSLSDNFSGLLPQSLQCSLVPNLKTSSSSLSQSVQSTPISVSQNYQPTLTSECHKMTESAQSMTITPISQTLSNPLPQSSMHMSFPPPPPLSVSSSLPHQHSQSSEVTSQKMVSSCLPLPQHTNLMSSNMLQSPENQSKSTPLMLSHSFGSDPSLDKTNSLQKGDANECSSTLAVPKSVAVTQTSASVDTMKPTFVQSPNVLQKQIMQPSSHHLEMSQNGQLHPEMSYMEHPLPLMHQHAGLQLPPSLNQYVQNLQPGNSKKKKTSNRQTSKKPHPQHTSPVGTQPSAADDSPFQQPPLTDHFHEHQFQPFAHPLPNSNFQPFQSYTPHKPILQIPYPQPLHPLQHNQEHSLTSHLPHMSHIYPMSANMTGSSPALSDIQPQPQRPWPTPQSTIPSFHSFGQSSQYYAPLENSQFPFQSPSLSMPQPSGAHNPQIGSNVSGTGLDHGSNACSSEL